MRIDKRGHKFRDELEWADVLKNYRDSGLGMEAFCRGEGIHVGSLRRRLSVSDVSSSSFVELPVPEERRANRVELRFGSGLVLRIEEL
jgi:hypothetical protein